MKIEWGWLQYLFRSYACFSNLFNSKKIEPNEKSRTQCSLLIRQNMNEINDYIIGLFRFKLINLKI